MNNQNRILKKICEKNFSIRLAHITEGEQINPEKECRKN